MHSESIHESSIVTALVNHCLRLFFIILSVRSHTHTHTRESERRTLTGDHEQLVELLQDLDLEHRVQSRDVCERVLDDVQSVQTLLWAHQHDLKHTHTHTHDHCSRAEHKPDLIWIITPLSSAELLYNWYWIRFITDKLCNINTVISVYHCETICII